jgi:hypothetical protein
MIPRCIKRPCRISFSYASFTSTAYVHRSQPPPPQDKFNYNQISFIDTSVSDHAGFPRVTANELERHITPPRRVKMLVRDFIEDSLYNPNYGYFPKQATIFDLQDAAFDFPSLRDSAEFQEEVAKHYDAYGVDQSSGPGRQLWHTPTELFKVHSTSGPSSHRAD